MIVRFIKAVVIVITIVGLVLPTQQQAMAGGWDFKPGLNGGPHIYEYHHDDSDYSQLSETAPPTPHPRNVPYSVILHNQSDFTIAYSLNGQREPRLKRGESARWTILGSRENPAVFNISFDNGQQRTIRYRLGNNTAHDFHDKGNGIDLYKRR